MTKKIVIVEKFNVQTGDYGQFRKNILDKLKLACPKSLGIPIVGPHEENEWNWIFVEVNADGCKIVLAICADTLYLYGWSKGGLGENYIWAITSGECERVELPGAKEELPFGGNYMQIGKPTTIKIDRNYLQRAVIVLHNCNDIKNPHVDTAEYFLSMVVTFCAGVRIKTIYRTVYDGLRNGSGKKFLNGDDEREKHWRFASYHHLSGIITHPDDGYGNITDDCVKAHLSVLFCHSKGDYGLRKSTWQTVILPKSRNKGKEEKSDYTKYGGGSTSSRSLKQSSHTEASSTRKATDVGRRRSTIIQEVKI